ncbi:helix-turn-helix domain-containing protein [Nocardia concava]|uniref:helix-turn-helix domain-containing protein n=1 Tax=Nocardia concava TaxID=257281 RepID=UPI0002D5B1BB|nr:helix-turn-helix transcriptional regulator [Nocardia concava]
MADEDSTLPRRQLGRFLRQYREEVGMTMAQAAKIVEIGTSTLHRLEKGTADKVRIRIITHLCEIYERSADDTAAMKRLAEQAAAKTWYQEYGDPIPGRFDHYVGLEAAAKQMISYQELVPGLLQTREYAWTMIRNHLLDASEREVERFVDLRLRRQAIVNRKTAPVEYDVVLHESALRRVVGGARIMAKQLRHLADAGTRPNLTVRVLPFGAGIPMGLLPGPFVILDFGLDTKGRPVEPPVVYLESVLTADIYLQKDGDLQRYRAVSAALHDASSTPEDSRLLLRKIAKEYEA